MGGILRIRPPARRGGWGGRRSPVVRGVADEGGPRPSRGIVQPVRRDESLSGCRGYIHQVEWRRGGDRRGSGEGAVAARGGHRGQGVEISVVDQMTCIIYRLSRGSYGCLDGNGSSHSMQTPNIEPEFKNSVSSVIYL